MSQFQLNREENEGKKEENIQTKKLILLNSNHTEWSVGNDFYSMFIVCIIDAESNNRLFFSD